MPDFVYKHNSANNEIFYLLMPMNAADSLAQKVSFYRRKVETFVKFLEGAYMAAL